MATTLRLRTVMVRLNYFGRDLYQAGPGHDLTQAEPLGLFGDMRYRSRRV